MEIAKEQAIEALKRWQEHGATVALWFAARGGTAGVTMLARITRVSGGIVFRNESSVLRFALHKARYEYGPLLFFRFPAKEGAAQINGMHIYLESGHWLFVCDDELKGARWLKALSEALESDDPKQLESGDTELACRFKHSLPMVFRSSCTVNHSHLNQRLR